MLVCLWYWCAYLFRERYGGAPLSKEWYASYMTLPFRKVFPFSLRPFTNYVSCQRGVEGLANADKHVKGGSVKLWKPLMGCVKVENAENVGLVNADKRWQKGGNGVSLLITADQGGNGGQDRPKFGWHNLSIVHNHHPLFTQYWMLLFLHHIPVSGSGCESTDECGKVTIMTFYTGQ